jgi:hypothetical protein
MNSLASRMKANDGTIRYLHDKEGLTEQFRMGTPKEIKYLGVMRSSVEIHFRDGSGIRITNPDKFTAGLDIRTMDNA